LVAVGEHDDKADDFLTNLNSKHYPQIVLKHRWREDNTKTTTHPNEFPSNDYVIQVLYGHMHCANLGVSLENEISHGLDMSSYCNGSNAHNYTPISNIHGNISYKNVSAAFAGVYWDVEVTKTGSEIWTSTPQRFNVYNACFTSDFANTW